MKTQLFRVVPLFLAVVLATPIAMVRGGEIKDPEFDWQPLFHPDPAMTQGYELLG